MCGIVGYVGDKECAPILIEGLKKLEYRGYDSAGIAIYKDKDISVVKAKGRLADLEKKLNTEGTPQGICGIGHTRWATHGEPSDINSHPHSVEKVVVVHNGIIENYRQIKQILEEKGITFSSQTDSEAVAQLLNYYYKTNPLDAIIKTMNKIRGSYAFGIMFRDVPDTLYAVRKDSPLIVGLSEGENFIASDIPAILSRTRNYYLLDEQEIAVIRKDSVAVYDTAKEIISKEVMTATWDIEAAEKGGFAHFMLKEIFEQPKALRDTINPRILNGIENILKTELDSLNEIKRLHIVACGSAMHAGLLGKSAIESLARIPVEVDVASEFRYRNPIFLPGDACIIISQSGETADSLAALRLAKREGVPTIAIVNVVGSSIAREADKVIYIWAGPEIAVATTKAYTAQIAVLYLFALRLAYEKKTINSKRANELFEALADLPNKVEEVLKNCNHYQYLASLYQNARDLFFIGRGQDYALCCEGSLKLKEISYIHSEAYAAGELKHGTISLITEGIPVIACATDETLLEKTVSNIKEVKARGASVIFLSSLNEIDCRDFADKFYNNTQSRCICQACYCCGSPASFCLLYLCFKGLRC